MKKLIGIALALAVLGTIQGFAAARQRPAAAPAAAPTQPATPLPLVEPVVASPTATPAPPAHETVNPDPKNSRGDLIEVSIAEQRLTVWRDGVVVYRFVVSTGRKGYETPTGRFRVHTKYENRWSRKWKVWMPYAIFWHPKYGYAFHELPYHPGRQDRRVGASKLGTPDSHGCVRVNLGDAKKLYDFTKVGTPVWVH